mmetsp:Transcript_25813/g.50439  ORF Transcript_25813/g.50439 Transcript_25813/m.50439 type:complete len:237 (-) Transcript_25813:150-860(-)
MFDGFLLPCMPLNLGSVCLHAPNPVRRVRLDVRHLGHGGSAGVGADDLRKSVCLPRLLLHTHLVVPVCHADAVLAVLLLLCCSLTLSTDVIKQMFGFLAVLSSRSAGGCDALPKLFLLGVVLPHLLLGGLALLLELAGDVVILILEPRDLPPVRPPDPVELVCHLTRSLDQAVHLMLDGAVAERHLPLHRVQPVQHTLLVPDLAVEVLHSSLVVRPRVVARVGGIPPQPPLPWRRS